MDTLASVLLKARESAGLSQPALTQKIMREANAWIAPSWIGQVERGEIKRPDRQRLALVARALKIEITYVLTLADYAPETLEEVQRIPIVDIAAGPGVIHDYVMISRDEMSEYGELVAYRVRGTSMEPDYPDGALLFAEQRQAAPGDTVVAWTEAGGVVKRLEERDGRLYLAGNGGPAIPVDEGVVLGGVVVKRLV